ncbi:prolyl 4-hydroxylase subunit alpha-1-like [Mizuhopecten yessoensis]|uniref:prolyl 4-hydroxylase subunit alpha-1-like n=1 Tax=Mizuhopecten yessoensis TaxID=6573 RepID=UPI000B45D892|nr:prolyl 4-hydroxylase subunit alpha-1-like [Mizuhopecten yessoensis]
MKVATVIGADGKKTQNLHYRTGASTWVEPRKNISLKLEKRVELLTGLDTFYRKEVNTSQYFNMVNYGLGGHYIPHLDAVNSRTYKKEGWNNTFGDRIATWMFYLNTVEAGGATVFPILNLKIFPIKGSAVFWYNLLPSGVIDERTMHASCPVLLGTKWITTKWILEYGQEFRRPCKTNIMDEDF